MKVLWLDDLSNETFYQPLRAAMVGVGLDVTSVVDESSLHLELKAGPPDLFIIDFQLPGTSGIEVSQRLLAKNLSIPILFLSEFTPQYPVRHQIDPRARFAVLFKPVEDFEEWAIENLMPTVTSLMGARSAGDDSRCGATIEPFGIWEYSLDELDALDLDRYFGIAEETSDRVQEFTSPVFESSSAEWIVVIRVDMELRIVGWGQLDERSPTSDQLRQLERRHNAPALVVSRPVLVEMLGGDGVWPSCSFVRDDDQRALDRFPAIDLELNGVPMTTHVDTGSLHSWLSYEDAQRLNIVPVQRDRRAWRTCFLSTIGNPGSSVLWTEYDARTEGRARDGFTSIDYQPRVVQGWRSCALARRCPMGNCPESDRVQDVVWCGSRRGLVGRDVLRRNRFLLVFDSIRSVTYVVADDDSGEEGDVDEWEWTPLE